MTALPCPALPCMSRTKSNHLFHELFTKTDLKRNCAMVTSYAPNVAHSKVKTTERGDTDNLTWYQIDGQMLADWLNEPSDKAIGKAEKFEQAMNKKFIEEPGQMKLLIMVDKLLTGFDAPSTICPLHRQTDARPRPVAGHPPGEPARR